MKHVDATSAISSAVSLTASNKCAAYCEKIKWNFYFLLQLSTFSRPNHKNSLAIKESSLLLHIFKSWNSTTKLVSWPLWNQGRECNFCCTWNPSHIAVVTQKSNLHYVSIKHKTDYAIVWSQSTHLFQN